MVRVDSAEYSILSGPVFDPAKHGLKVTSFSTACRRGYCCTYEVAQGALTLTSLIVGLTRNDIPPEINGSSPKRVGGRWEYTALALPVRYTGEILAADVVNQIRLDIADGQVVSVANEGADRISWGGVWLVIVAVSATAMIFPVNTLLGRWGF